MVVWFVERVLGRLVLPRGWTRQWNGPVPILPAYVDLLIKREYLPAIREALWQPSPLMRFLKG